MNQFIVTGTVNGQPACECFTSDTDITNEDVCLHFSSAGWSNITVFGGGNAINQVASAVGQVQRFTLSTVLHDAVEPSRSVRIDLSRGAETLWLHFDGHTDYCSDHDASYQLSLSYFDGQVDVTAYTDRTIDDPTHRFDFKKARVG